MARDETDLTIRLDLGVARALRAEIEAVGVESRPCLADLLAILADGT